MCSKSFFRRFGAFVAALVLCFALCVPALADVTLNGNAYIFGAQSSNSNATFSKNSYFLVQAGTSSSGLELKRSLPSDKLAFYGLQLNDPALLPSDTSIGIYFSFWYRSNDGFVQNKVPSVSDFSIGVRMSGASSYSFKPVSSVILFSPSDSVSSVSDGVSVVARIDNSLGNPYSSWLLRNASASSATDGDLGPCSFYVSPVSSWSSSGFPSLAYSSFRVVSSASNAELDALEDMASNISEQSQILSQFYGDIVAVCNQIYQRLGDLQAAQEESNRLFSNVISLLNTTNGKIEAINMAMSTYFELLINQLKQEGIDTRTAIADAEARLELYLKPMIDYFSELEKQTGESASTLPGHKQDIDGFNNQGFGIDSDGQTGIAALVPILSAFGWIWSIIALFIGVGLIHILVKKGVG